MEKAQNWLKKKKEEEEEGEGYLWTGKRRSLLVGDCDNHDFCIWNQDEVEAHPF